MATLTADDKLTGAQFRLKRSGRASAGTYYVGTAVMFGGDDYLLKPLSGSAVAGTTAAGIVTVHQELDNNGEQLDYEVGEFHLVPNGFDAAPRPNQLVFMEDDTVAYQAHSAGRHKAGYFRGMVTGSVGSRSALCEIGLVGSGSVE